MITTHGARTSHKRSAGNVFFTSISSHILNVVYIIGASIYHIVIFAYD